MVSFVLRVFGLSFGYILKDMFVGVCVCRGYISVGVSFFFVVGLVRFIYFS